ncbi:MAG: DUF2961 domain-containing protein [Armatimonadetes bacterium]|nr:DUF2961 domain-containing protein [Armatimonadota bacterium]
MTVLPLLVIAIAPQISVETLLPQLTDLHRLYQPPKPAYTCSQASSYDRRSKTPGNADWFANGDAGQFLRDEQVDGRVEHVMADLKGPGTVVRVWSANPAGVVRFYFDGESTPRVEEKLSDLLSAKHKPFGYSVAKGWDLYFPFPFAKSLKITVDNSDENSRHLYYHVGYRTYTDPVNVLTYTVGDLDNAGHEPAAAAFEGLRPVEAKTTNQSKTMRLSAIGMGSFSLSKPGVIEELSVTVPPAWAMAKAGPANARLRDLELQIDFDGEKCVRVPVSDFFGCAPGLTPYSTMVTRVEASGKLVSHWKMPFAKSAVIRLVNHSGHAVTANISAKVKAGKVSAPFYRFHAQWTVDNTGTRPFRDLVFLDAQGSGQFVGTGLHIGNSNSDWWGEGDEKVWVDGESFPSTFGTGTEDYFGYAWSNPEVFQKPYHAQPRADGPGCGGQVSNLRWHIFDSIPFTNHLKFALEAWHWKADSACSWASTSYWYAAPKSSQAKAVDTKRLAPVEFVKPKPIVGAIEGEGLTILEKTGGKTENQGGFANLSNGLQLWWQDSQPGANLILKLNVAKAGTYEIVGNFCHAKDYGIHHIWLDDIDLGVHDFYISGLEWRKLSLGKHLLTKGDHKLRVENAGTNEKADPKSYMFGLDYLLLKAQ